MLRFVSFILLHSLCCSSSSPSPTRHVSHFVCFVLIQLHWIPLSSFDFFLSFFFLHFTLTFSLLLFIFVVALALSLLRCYCCCCYHQYWLPAAVFFVFFSASAKERGDRETERERLRESEYVSARERACADTTDSCSALLHSALCASALHSLPLSHHLSFGRSFCQLALFVWYVGPSIALSRPLVGAHVASCVTRVSVALCASVCACVRVHMYACV